MEVRITFADYTKKKTKFIHETTTFENVKKLHLHIKTKESLGLYFLNATRL